MNDPKREKNNPNYLSLGNMPHIEMEGNKSFSLSGKFSIAEYSEEEIKIKTSGILINILGNDLVISFATDTNIFITGKFLSIEYI